MKTAEDFKQELNELTLYIQDVDAKIKAGDEEELDGLDDKIDFLCQQIEAAPQDIAQAVEPDFARMISALEQIALTLQSKIE